MVANSDGAAEIMPHRVIITPDDLDALGRVLASLKLPITVQWKAGRDRSLDQNALMWMWAAESAAQRGDQTADETQREWKLVHGVPILRSEDAEFCQFYDQHLKRAKSRSTAATSPLSPGSARYACAFASG
jgi:hypothetical protein